MWRLSKRERKESTVNSTNSDKSNGHHSRTKALSSIFCKLNTKQCTRKQIMTVKRGAGILIQGQFKQFKNIFQAFENFIHNMKTMVLFSSFRSCSPPRRFHTLRTNPPTPILTIIQDSCNSFTLIGYNVKNFVVC